MEPCALKMLTYAKTYHILSWHLFELAGRAISGRSLLGPLQLLVHCLPLPGFFTLYSQLLNLLRYSTWDCACACLNWRGLRRCDAPFPCRALVSSSLHRLCDLFCHHIPDSHLPIRGSLPAAFISHSHRMKLADTLCCLYTFAVLLNGLGFLLWRTFVPLFCYCVWAGGRTFPVLVTTNAFLSSCTSPVAGGGHPSGIRARRDFPPRWTSHRPVDSSLPPSLSYSLPAPGHIDLRCCAAGRGRVYTALRTLL
jgi:hypothetical protein